MKNIKGVISYIGTHYLGWQKTKTGPSIEESLERVLSQILQEPISLQAASRTDRGVHAEGQVINFFTQKDTLDLERLTLSVRQLLPKDITLLSLEIAPEPFHPTLDALGKEYHYYITPAEYQLPFLKDFAWHLWEPLEISLMQEACNHFLGTQDFAAFTNERAEDTIRTLYDLEVKPLSSQLMLIRIRGNSFLYKMVRNIVGTLLYIGCGKIKLADLPCVFASGRRALAGVTAPAHGLFLKKVFYTPFSEEKEPVEEILSLFSFAQMTK